MLPVADDEDGAKFTDRLKEIIEKYHNSIVTIQESKNQTQTVVEDNAIE